MTRNAFEFLRRYIHFCDNSKRIPAGDAGYDILFKVRYPLNLILKGIRKAWVPGKHIAVDESMIKYMGRAVSFVQYMPAKPIKHGVKVYAICCGSSAILLGYKIYCGVEVGFSNHALDICDLLIREAALGYYRGRVLYTDNWYTSVKLAIHLFQTFGWTMVGTISPTDKKSREDLDVPFLKLSNGARDSVKRGWLREAVVKVILPHAKVLYIQCTSWKDSKQVMFVSTNRVGCSSGIVVKRHVKGQKLRNELDGCMAQQDYIQYFNAVDRNDRDSADYSTTIRTNRYYLRIFCWALDRAVRRYIHHLHSQRALGSMQDVE